MLLATSVLIWSLCFLISKIQCEIVITNPKIADIQEKTLHYWAHNAQNSLTKLINEKVNTNRAKNVILFLGDRMSIPTLAAARVYLGQLNGKPGEETQLSFEKFPYTALSKTYCVDAQVADSACTATAYLNGVKANLGTIGVNAWVKQRDCETYQDSSTHLTSIARWSQWQGKRTGLVTTARVTHASPTGVYGSTPYRDWESDYDVAKDGYDPILCPDIAHQLITGQTGKELNVIMGGGRKKLLPNSMSDEDGIRGQRLDDRNLINEWLIQKNGQGRYVYNRTSLKTVTNDTDYILGLFEANHCKYHLDADENDPSLEEMVEVAIKILSKQTPKDNGFFLFVEGARIDMAHHDTQAVKALDETIEFHKAIQKAVEMTNEQETLIVVTSDHAHTMSMSGYPARGNDIFEYAGIGTDGKPYSTLSYANGPIGFQQDNGERHDLRQDNMHNKDYLYPAYAPRGFETHGRDDVGVFCRGPWSHLCKGVIEQNVIPHIMAYASCVGEGITMCRNS